MEYVRRRQWHPLQYSCLENPMDGGAWKAAVHGVAEGQTQLSDFTFHFHALEKEMATHSSVLAWRSPGTGEPGGLPSMGSHRVGHDWSDLAVAAVWNMLRNRSRKDKEGSIIQGLYLALCMDYSVLSFERAKFLCPWDSEHDWTWWKQLSTQRCSDLITRTCELLLLFSRSVVFNSATSWTVAHQASLSMGFSRQDYWSGLPFPSPGNMLPYVVKSNFVDVIKLRFLKWEDYPRLSPWVQCNHKCLLSERWGARESEWLDVRRTNLLAGFEMEEKNYESNNWAAYRS